MTDAFANDAERRRQLALVIPKASSIAWGAIFAGVVIALVAQLAFSVLGLGIGSATIDPATTGTPSANRLAAGAVVWWIVSGSLASALGGYVAGRLSGRSMPSEASYHGLVSWGVTTIIVVFFLSSAVGGVFGSALNAVTNTLGGTGRLLGGPVQTVAQTAAPSLPGLSEPLASIETQIRSATGEQDPAQLRDIAVESIKAAVSGDAIEQRAALNRASEALAKAQNISVDQARTQVQGYRQQYEDALTVAKARSTKIADAAARTTSRASLIIVFGLALGALAATLGGRLAYHPKQLSSVKRGIE